MEGMLKIFLKLYELLKNKWQKQLQKNIHLILPIVPQRIMTKSTSCTHSGTNSRRFQLWLQGA